MYISAHIYGHIHIQNHIHMCIHIPLSLTPASHFFLTHLSRTPLSHSSPTQPKQLLHTTHTLHSHTHLQYQHRTPARPRQTDRHSHPHPSPTQLQHQHQNPSCPADRQTYTHTVICLWERDVCIHTLSHTRPSLIGIFSININRSLPCRQTDTRTHTPTPLSHTHLQYQHQPHTRPADTLAQVYTVHLHALRWPPIVFSWPKKRKGEVRRGIKQIPYMYI